MILVNVSSHLSYDKLAVTALLSFYSILNAVVIKVNAVTQMGMKVNKNFDVHFFKEMLKNFLSVLKITCLF